jgi:hypothetical protein
MPLFIPEICTGTPKNQIYVTTTADLSSTSAYTTYATLITTTATFSSAILRCTFTACFDSNVANLIGYFRLRIDGSTAIGCAQRTVGAGEGSCVTLVGQRSVTSGSRTVLVQWAVNSGSGNTLRIQAATYPNLRHAALLIEELQG